MPCPASVDIWDLDTMNLLSHSNLFSTSLINRKKKNQMSVQVLTPKSWTYSIQEYIEPACLTRGSLCAISTSGQPIHLNHHMHLPSRFSLPTPHTSLHTNTFPWDDQETELSPVAAKCMRQWQRQKLRKFEAPTAGALLIRHWLSLLCYFTVEETTTYSVLHHIESTPTTQLNVSTEKFLHGF